MICTATCCSAAKGPHNPGTRCQSESHSLCSSQPASDKALGAHCTWNLEYLGINLINWTNYMWLTSIWHPICKHLQKLWMSLGMDSFCGRIKGASPRASGAMKYGVPTVVLQVSSSSTSLDLDQVTLRMDKYIYIIIYILIYSVYIYILSIM